jgi:hypothetical protein
VSDSVRVAVITKDGVSSNWKCRGIAVNHAVCRRHNAGFPRTKQVGVRLSVRPFRMRSSKPSRQGRSRGLVLEQGVLRHAGGIPLPAGHLWLTRLIAAGRSAILGSACVAMTVKVGVLWDPAGDCGPRGHPGGA